MERKWVVVRWISKVLSHFVMSSRRVYVVSNRRSQKISLRFAIRTCFALDFTDCSLLLSLVDPSRLSPSLRSSKSRLIRGARRSPESSPVSCSRILSFLSLSLFVSDHCFPVVSALFQRLLCLGGRSESFAFFLCIIWSIADLYFSCPSLSFTATKPRGRISGQRRVSTSRIKDYQQSIDQMVSIDETIRRKTERPRRAIRRPGDVFFIFCEYTVCNYLLEEEVVELS